MNTIFSLEKNYPKDFFANHWLKIQDSNIVVLDPPSFPNFWEKILHFVKRFIELLKKGSSTLLTISRHLVSYCNGLDLTTFTHQQLSNILKNVKTINKKICSHNQKTWLPFLRAPTLDRQISTLQTRLKETALNENIQQLLFFPSKEKFKTQSVFSLMDAWNKNNEILAGILATHKIGPIGFSGQGDDGLNKLLQTRRSSSKAMEGYLWAAGYNYQLDPITFLADLNLIVDAAYCYALSSSNKSKYGGVFVVNTEGEEAYSEKIGSNASFGKLEGFLGNSLESTAGSALIDLITRKNDWHPPNYSEFKMEETISTMKIPTTNEVTLKFDENEYSKRVYGVITMDQLLYPKSFCYNLYEEYKEMKLLQGPIAAIPYIQRYLMAGRLNRQHLILNALDKIGVVSKATTFDAEQYRLKGEALFKDISTQTTIKVEDLKKVAGQHWNVKNGDYWYV